MRRLLIIFLFWAVPSFANIALDGANHAQKDNGTTASTTAVVAMPGATAGDLITCEISFSDGASNTFTSVHDAVNAGNYTAAITLHHNTTTGQWNGIYYMANSASSGAFNITLTTSGSLAFAAMSCQAWTGVLTSSPEDGTGQQQDAVNTVNPTTGAGLTPAGAGELVIGFVEPSVQTPTAGSSYTRIDANPTTICFPEYWIQTTATSTNAPYVMAIQDSWTDQMVFFKPISVTLKTMPAAVY